jgi:YegS/Rv2252/BmrU family lipid kinase
VSPRPALATGDVTRAVPGRRALVLCNPSSSGGRAGAAITGVGQRLEAHGLPYRVVTTRSLEHALEEATSACARGEVVATLGGDGLAGRVAGVVSDLGGTLSVLPAGRGNDFARAVGLPERPEDAATVLATGRGQQVDLGEATDVDGRRRPFLGILSIGLDSEVQRIAETTRLPLGRHTYAYGAVAALRRWRSLPFTVEIDDDAVRMSGFTVAVANSGVYGGGMRLAPDARLDDGHLDVVLISGTSRLRLLRGLTHVNDGTHVDDEHVTVRAAREVAIRSTAPAALRLTAYADGERVSRLPLRVRVLPRALDVLLPTRTGGAA